MIYFALLVGNPNNLAGKFASYKFFPHDWCDVLEFENGLVTMKTCCGNSYEGSYEIRNSTWTWYYQSVIRENPPQFRFKEPVKIHVEPRFFSSRLDLKMAKH